MLLLKYFELQNTYGWSLSNLVALLRQQLFVYRNLTTWLNDPFQALPASAGIHARPDDVVLGVTARIQTASWSYARENRETKRIRCGNSDSSGRTLPAGVPRRLLSLTRGEGELSPVASVSVRDTRR